MTSSTMTFLSQLNWRWATKSFDPSKPVSQEQLKTVLNAIKMAPSSLGIQPFRVYIISDESLKTKISEAAFNQPQPKQAPYTLVFCADNDTAKRSDSYIDISSHHDPEQMAKMEGFKQMTNGVSSMSAEARMAWAAQQACVALGFGIAACMELEIDSCPMGGFNPQAMDIALELPSNLHSVALLALGYRSREPDRPKFRFPDEELFISK